MREKGYNTSLNSCGFRFSEIKIVANLKAKGFSEAEAKEKIFKENLFQQKETSTQRIIDILFSRVKVLDAKLLDYLINGNVDLAKEVNFYSILKTDQLFFEFMQEVIAPKLNGGVKLLEKKDLNAFFRKKAEYNPKVAKWSESTVKRLKGGYKSLLYAMDYLNKGNKGKDKGKLNKIFISSLLKEHLHELNEDIYLKAMGA